MIESLCPLPLTVRSGDLALPRHGYIHATAFYPSTREGGVQEGGTCTIYTFKLRLHRVN